MAKKKRSRSKAGWKGDPLVPINCDALRALMLADGVSVAELSRRTGDSEQTLANLAKAQDAKKCRRSRRARIAKALDAPEGALSGERIVIPIIPLQRGPFEYLHTARTELAASRLLTEVANACKRDVANATLNPPEEATAAPPQILIAQALEYVSECLQIGEWRQRLLEWLPGFQENRGYTEPPIRNAWTDRQQVPYDEQHEAAVLSLARALEHILRPWFDGQARLNYRALRDLVHLPRHPFAEVKETASPFNPNAVIQPFAPTPHDGGAA